MRALVGSASTHKNIHLMFGAFGRLWNWYVVRRLESDCMCCCFYSNSIVLTWSLDSTPKNRKRSPEPWTNCTCCAGSCSITTLLVAQSAWNALLRHREKKKLADQTAYIERRTGEKESHCDLTHKAITQHTYVCSLKRCISADCNTRILVPVWSTFTKFHTKCSGRKLSCDGKTHLSSPHFLMYNYLSCLPSTNEREPPQAHTPRQLTG